MAATLTIVDEKLTGERTPVFTLDSLTETMTIREVIRARIYEEVQDFNQKQKDGLGIFRGLIQPSDTEVAMNGFKMKKPKHIDWEKQYEMACEAFEKNGFFVIVGDRQAESLDETFDVKVDTEVSFLKLVPLVGG